MVFRYDYDKNRWINQHGIVSEENQKFYIHNTWVNGIHLLYIKIFNITMEIKI